MWPRSMFPPPLTEADVRAYQMYAAAQQRRPELAVVLQNNHEPAQADGQAKAAQPDGQAKAADDTKKA
jgi:hypothetical protein